MKKIALIGLVLLVLMTGVGCSSKEKNISQNSSSTSASNKPYIDVSQPDIPRPSLEPHQEILPEPMNNPKPNEGLIIKTDNQIITGKQQVVEELDKTADELLKSLDSMETIVDDDLNLEGVLLDEE